MNVLLGLAFIVAGIAGCVAEYRHAPVHPWLLACYGGLALLGALIIRPDPILDAFKKAGNAAGPYLPFGRRAYDNPPPKDPP